MTTAVIIRCLVSANGTTTHIKEPMSMAALKNLLSTDALSTLWLTGGIVMLMNAHACDQKLPVNRKATELYRSRARHSALFGTLAPIHGDVIVCPETDFG